MITALDSRERAGEWSLSPDVVEKDYVLGWLLAEAAKAVSSEGEKSCRGWSRSERTRRNEAQSVGTGAW